MMYLLNPRLWLLAAILAALSFTHGFAYKAGKSAVRADWDKDKAEQVARALDAEKAARAKEQSLQAEKTKVEARYAAEKKRNAAASASLNTELDGLRNALAAADAAGTNSAAACRTDADPRNRIIGECASVATQVAIAYDRLAAQHIGLQDYVKAVCK